MLFERIRRTQKPVFIFLAVAFALGFALLGVGSAGNINALDFLHLGSSNPNSISTLSDAVAKNPNNAVGWIRLAEAYSAANQPDQAINAYGSYLRLRPKDQSALTAVSTLYEQRAQLNSQNAAAYGAVASFYANSGAHSVLSGLSFSSLTDPLATDTAAPYEQQASALGQQVTTDLQQATIYRQSLAKLDPRNSFNQEALGIDAANARSYAVSAAAFKAFLKLVPASSPEAKRVKAFLKQVEALAASSSTPPTPSSGSGTGK
jgi:cytochrome c-type biogenesis protein CcmH/NrfG